MSARFKPTGVIYVSASASSHLVKVDRFKLRKGIRYLDALVRFEIRLGGIGFRSASNGGACELYPFRNSYFRPDQLAGRLANQDNLPMAPNP
jgi:hypothetical protein